MSPAAQKFAHDMLDGMTIIDAAKRLDREITAAVATERESRSGHGLALHDYRDGRMTQLERAIFDAEGTLLDALHAMRVHNFEMAAHYASTAVTLIEAIEERNEEMRNDQT
jgi:hypothetical protein